MPSGLDCPGLGRLGCTEYFRSSRLTELDIFNFFAFLWLSLSQIVPLRLDILEFSVYKSLHIFFFFGFYLLRTST